MTKDRRNLLLINQDDEFCLTILYPYSAYYDTKLFVIYEDAYGDAELKIMKPEAIAKNYNVSIEKINKFIDDITKEEN